MKTHTPRPDELTREAFEFIAAIDEYKRRHMRSFLDAVEVLGVLFSLGYEHPEFAGEVDGPAPKELSLFQSAVQRYRDEKGRLFPTWSEQFDILLALGYERDEPLTDRAGAA